MKILVSSEGFVVASASGFAFGAWEERDTLNGVVVHKWKAEDADGNTCMYYIDENRGAIDGSATPAYTVHYVDEVPEGAGRGKYLYIDGEFVENPEYTEPPKSDSERIADLEAQLEEMANAITEGVNEV